MIWITIDVGLAKHPKMAALPNDTARYGWLVTLCEAKVQRQPGRFASDRHFEQVVGRFAKYLPAYLEAHLFDREADGTLIVHDWPQHQWAVKKQRQRGDKEETLERQEGDKEETEKGLAGASRTVPVLVDVSTGVIGGPGEEGEPEFPLLQWLAQHGCYVRPGNGYHVQLVTGVERHGVGPILTMFDKLSRAGVIDGDTKGFVFGALDALKPKPNLKAVDAADAAERERKDFDRRVQRTKEEIAAMRGDA